MYVGSSDIATLSNSEFKKINNDCDEEDEYIIINENYVSKILSCPTGECIKKILKFKRYHQIK